MLYFCYLFFHLPIINNGLIFCGSLFVVSTLWCTSIYSLDTSYTLWGSSRKVTIFLVKSKATCLRAWSIWLYMKCLHAVFPWALWATDCSWGELLLGKQKYRQLFAFLGMFTMSLVLLEISLWKLRETEEFCTTVEFNYMQTSIWKYSNIFQFPNQDTFQARVELNLSFLCLSLAQKKNPEKYIMYNVSDL